MPPINHGIASTNLNLARLELKVMLDEVLTRQPDLELAGTVQRLYFQCGRGAESTPLRSITPT
jgi:cytochrome P450